MDATKEFTGSENQSSSESQKWVAIRGTTPMDRDMLQAHLAALMQSPNIGILLGAGSSICAGGYQMGEITENFLRRLQHLKGEDASHIIVQRIKSMLTNKNTDKNIENVISFLKMFEECMSKLCSNHPSILLSQKVQYMAFKTLLEGVLLDPRCHLGCTHPPEEEKEKEAVENGNKPQEEDQSKQDQPTLIHHQRLLKKTFALSTTGTTSPMDIHAQL